MNRRGFFGTLSKCVAAVATASVVKLESAPVSEPSSVEIDDVPEGEPYVTKSLPVSPTACAKCGKELVDAYPFVLEIPRLTPFDATPWVGSPYPALSTSCALTFVSCMSSLFPATYFQPEQPKQPEQYIELDGKRICMDCLIG